MFQPFFRWWWAAVTGLASLLAFLWTPPSGLHLSRSGMLAVAFGGLTLLFLVVSALAQAWLLYSDRYRPLEVVSVQRTDEFASGWAFVLKGHIHDGSGILVEIRRPLEDIEVPFAIVRVVGMTARGLFQAEPVWLSPGHLRDFKASRFSAASLIVRQHVHYDRTRNAFDEIRATEVANAG